MQRLKTKAQFQAAMAAGTVARTAHFALHRMPLDASAGPGESVESAAGGRAQAVPGADVPAPQALFAVRLPASEPWVGVVLPKRWARRAVTRNAIRRQVYAVSRDIESSLPPAAHVVRLRTGFDRATFTSPSSVPLKQAVRAELEQLFARAGRS